MGNNAGNGTAGNDDPMSSDETNSNGTNSNGTEPETHGGAAGEAGKPANAQPAARTAQAGAGEVLPTKAAEDDARSWGDRDEDHDAWLKEQRPPHWG